MVLEYLINPGFARDHPLSLFFLSILATIVAIIISSFLNQGGLFLVVLITFALLPLILKQLKFEESREEYDHFWTYLYSLKFFERHRKLILDYLYMILGVTLTISAAYVFLPTQTSNIIFAEQIGVINQITGQVSYGEVFEKILVNNIGVMVICFVLSLFYSVGAIFLISWNASVLGVVVGKSASALTGFYSIPGVLIAYMPHGTFEFVGYILAGIAGGLLSIALSRHRESKEHLKFVLKDSFMLLALATMALVIGAIIEVAAII